MAMDFWNQFAGQLLNGQYKLLQHSGLEGSCALFLTELPGQDRFGVVKIVRAASLEAERLGSSWKLAKDLQQARLVRVHATGTADLDGLRVVYGVMDLPDGKLDSVIQECPLNEEEAREVLVNSAEALEYLHMKRLVHGSVRPASIVAVEGETKLSTDSVATIAGSKKGTVKTSGYDAPELKSAGASPATDMWALGMTLFEALTQRLPAADFDRAELRALPGECGEIVQHCLEVDAAKRWTARQVLAFVQKGSGAAASAGATVNATPQKTASDPGPKLDLVMQPNVSSMTRFSMLRYTLAAGALLLGVAWLVTSSGSGKVTAAGRARPASPVTQVSEPIVSQPAAEVSRPGPDKPSTPAPEETARPVVTAPPPAHREGPTSGSSDRERADWRVILYAYASAQSAHIKVHSINAKVPNLSARVLSPGGRPMHLVVVGNNLGRQDALRLRKQLLARGFPRDIYVQNLPE